MSVRDFQERKALSSNAKTALLALAVLQERVDRMSKEDQDDLFDLLTAWRATADPEERESLQQAMEEILAQTPVTAQRMDLSNKAPVETPSTGAKRVGAKLRELRLKADLTQQTLAEKAGIPQSHISRIENAEYNATHITLSKLARALEVDVGDIDPRVD